MRQILAMILAEDAALLDAVLKYTERINTSKSRTSVMFCGNAVGDVLAPYVMYKAKHLWSTWCEGGPHGTRYNRTRYGLFDSHTFEEWFCSLLLPHLRKQNGKKVIIGDNLSRHINPHVLTMCQENEGLSSISIQTLLTVLNYRTSNDPLYEQFEINFLLCIYSPLYQFLLLLFH